MGQTVKQPPATLPANFFDAPETLPADFFNAAPVEDIASIKAKQAAKYPSAQERGLPTGADLRSLPQRAMAFLSGDTLKEQNPGLLADPVEAFGAVSMAPGTTAMQALKSFVPKSILPKSMSLPRIGAAEAKFEQVMGAAKDIPLELGKADDVALRALELAGKGKMPGRGSQLPKVLNDYIKTRELGQPMTYEVGRDFGSASSALSSKEARATTKVMKHQVNEFAAAMKDANRGAAEKVGLGKVYDEAMTEYRKAKNLEEAGKALIKWGRRVALGYVGIKGVGEILK